MRGSTQLLELSLGSLRGGKRKLQDASGVCPPSRQVGKWEQFCISALCKQGVATGGSNLHPHSLPPTRSSSFFFFFNLRCTTKSNYRYNAISIQIPMTICRSFLEKCLFISFAHFLIRWLFCYWIVWVSCTFCILTPC